MRFERERHGTAVDEEKELRIDFCQVYIEVAVEFPFSWIFQHFISEGVSSHVAASQKFKKKYGHHFGIGFNISAKQRIEENEVRGPSVARKLRMVEYTIFLPFDVILRKRNRNEAALKYLFRGAYEVFESWDIETVSLRKAERSIIASVLKDPAMLVPER